MHRPAAAAKPKANQFRDDVTSQDSDDVEKQPTQMYSWERRLPPFNPKAATLGLSSPAQDTSLDREKSSAAVSSECRGKGLGGIVEWLAPRLDGFLDRRCKAKPTGRIFPLPSSNECLAAVFS